jgi:hypothetical protein
MSALPEWRRTAFVCAVLALSMPATAAAQTFKIANWNIRSGKGIAGLTGPRLFDSDTANCTDPAQPLNAWGVGVPQAELRKLNGDPNVVALALEEAWHCAAPARVQEALGWSASLPDRNGTSIVARYGFAGPAIATQLDTSLNVNPKDTAWVVEVPVCVDARCARSALTFVAHWVGEEPSKDAQARQTVEVMASAREPHLLIGDLNAFDAEASNCPPPVPSTQLPMLRAAGYLDGWREVNGNAEGFTGMVNRAGCGVPNGNVFKRIDYGWSKDLLPVSMIRFAIAPIGADAPSDHYGIVVEYRLPDGTDPPVPTEIVLHAREAVSMVGHVKAVADPDAAGGARVYFTNLDLPKVATPIARPTTYIELTFTAAAETPYHLWIRGFALADCWCNDSAWVQFSDSVDAGGRARYRIGAADAAMYSIEQCLNCGVAGWGWNDNHWGVAGALGADLYFTIGGSHTIRIQPREDGLSLDQIVLSSSRYRFVAPGANKHDRTIVPSEPKDP